MLAGDRSDAAPGELAAVVRAVAAVENGLLPSAQSVLAAARACIESIGWAVFA